MELVFVRHGEGEHVLAMPASLERLHPRLTDAGRAEVAARAAEIGVASADLLLASPTVRTLETARLLAGAATCVRYVTPLVGPRMFPQNPTWNPLGCDRILAPTVLAAEHSDFALLEPADSPLWVSSINQLPAASFRPAATALLAWCAARVARVIVVAHDGTINNYRELCGETVTRADFLPNAGVYRRAWP